MNFNLVCPFGLNLKGQRPFGLNLTGQWSSLFTNQFFSLEVYFGALTL